MFPFQSSQCPLPTGLTPIFRGSASRLLLKAGTAVSAWAIPAHESRRGDTTMQDKPLATSGQQQSTIIILLYTHGWTVCKFFKLRQKGTDSRNCWEGPWSFTLFVLLLASTLKHCTFRPQFLSASLWHFSASNYSIHMEMTTIQEEKKDKWTKPHPSSAFSYLGRWKHWKAYDLDVIFMCRSLNFAFTWYSVNWHNKQTQFKRAGKSVILIQVRRLHCSAICTYVQSATC